MKTETEDILGYRVDRRGLEDCVDDVIAWIKGDACRWLACLNPHSYVVALDDPAFAKALHEADWLVPDGQGIVLASRLLGGAIRRRVTGSDIFAGVNRHLNDAGGRSVFSLVPPRKRWPRSAPAWQWTTPVYAWQAPGRRPSNRNTRRRRTRPCWQQSTRRRRMCCGWA